MSLTIKADGDTERQLLDLLTRLSAMPSQWSPPTSASAAMVPIEPSALSMQPAAQPAISQQQLDDLLYLTQQQQLQLEQSQRAIADYQQAFISLTDNAQPALPPASTAANNANEVEEGLIAEPAETTESIATPRYITGGLGNAQQDNRASSSANAQETNQIVNASYRTAQNSTCASKQQRRSSQSLTSAEKWMWRLFSLLLLFTAMTTVTWVSFKWIAPAIDSFFNLEVVSPAGEREQEMNGKEIDEQESAGEEIEDVEEPASSLSEPSPNNPPVAPGDGTHPPGSAQSKAGSQPNALPNALEGL